MEFRDISKSTKLDEIFHHKKIINENQSFPAIMSDENNNVQIKAKEKRGDIERTLEKVHGE